MSYIATPYSWTGRTDSQVHERVYQNIQSIDLEADPLPQSQKILLGFASDEGVRRNLGRTGAAQGPDAIRAKLGTFALQKPSTLFDAGNVIVANRALESAQQILATHVCALHQQQNKLILLGGGHEIAWPHYLGLAQAFPNKKIGIINFDAHFDLRAPGEQGPSSGTPFWQVQQHHPNQFHYMALGIQHYANTKSLFDTAQQYHVRYLLRDDMGTSALQQQLEAVSQFINSVDLIYLTICLDAFDISIAPGVSAPSTHGLTLEDFLPFFKMIVSHPKCRSMDIAELSPPLDEHEKTTRLAAWLCHQMLISTEGL